MTFRDNINYIEEKCTKINIFALQIGEGNMGTEA